MLFGKKKDKKTEHEEEKKVVQEEQKAEKKPEAEPAEIDSAVFSSRIAATFGKMYRMILSVSLSANVCQIESGDRNMLGRAVPVRMYYEAFLDFAADGLHPEYKEEFLKTFSRENLVKELSRGTGSVVGNYCFISKDFSASGEAAQASEAEADDAAEVSAVKEPSNVLDGSEEEIQFNFVEIRAERIPDGGTTASRCIIYVRSISEMPVKEAPAAAAKLSVEEEEQERDWNSIRMARLIGGVEPVFIEYNIAEDTMHIHLGGPTAEPVVVKKYLDNIENRSDWTIFHSDIGIAETLLKNAINGVSGSADIRYRSDKSRASKFRIHKMMVAPADDEHQWVVGVLTDIDEEARTKAFRKEVTTQIDKMMASLYTSMYEIDTNKDLMYKIIQTDEGFERSDKPQRFSEYMKSRISSDIIAEPYKKEYEKWLRPEYLEKKTIGTNYEVESQIKLPGSPEYRWYLETITRMDSPGRYLRFRKDITEQHEFRNREYQLQEQNRYVEYNRKMLDTMASLVEFRNIESGPHIHQVRSLTRIILEDLAARSPQYGISKRDIDLYSEAATMHDIGKIVIPDRVLNKEGKLTPEEWEIMKSHTSNGALIVDKLVLPGQEELMQICRDVAIHHHERFDGSGYPDGLVGDQNAIGVQAVGLADVYDAMVSSRVYKGEISHEDTVEQILAGKSGSFNPLILETFRACKGKMRALYEK